MTTATTELSNATMSALKKYFEQINARDWLRSADSLWQAGDLLFADYRASTDDDGVPVHAGNIALNTPATLLYGYSMENILKGLLVKKFQLKPNEYKGRSGWKMHNLTLLFKQTGSDCGDHESQAQYQMLLKTLSAFIVWAGRYPVPFEIPAALDGFFPLRPETRSVLEKLYELLRAELWDGLYPKAFLKR